MEKGLKDTRKEKREKRLNVLKLKGLRGEGVKMGELRSVEEDRVITMKE